MQMLNLELLTKFLVSCCLVFLPYFANAQSRNSNQFGSISLAIKGGNVDAPSFTMLSPSLQGRVVFRGQTESLLGNTLIFHLVPDLLDPLNTDKSPFDSNQFITQKARLLAVTSNDVNKTLDRIDILDGGFGYTEPPLISIDLPSGSVRGTDFEPAEATAILDIDGKIVSIQLTNKGMGFDSVPKVAVQGGVHFLRLTDQNSSTNGKYYRISGNTEKSITLANPYSEDLSGIFLSNSMVEVFQAWTLGDLFGYDSVELTSGNADTADIIYLLKAQNNQIGNNENDYTGFYHDGTTWKQIDGDGTSADNQIIFPGESFILSRRTPNDLNLVLSGNPLTESTLLQIPAAGKKLFISNPFGLDVMLSDLIDPIYVDKNSSNPFAWLAHENQELADNVRILHQNVWSTYWHDGSNRDIQRRAWATAKPGSGVGASITSIDFSMSSGEISNITNNTEDIIITSSSHGLIDGFVVKISNARGRKTNSLKNQVDSEGNEVLNGLGVVVESSANGYHEIKVLDDDRFSLVNRLGNSDFISDGKAKWSTGSGGLGYTHDATVLFVGGGGFGARGNAKVEDGRVVSISITEPGAGYVEAPEILFSFGGWRKLGGGSTPQSDIVIPSGSGIMLVRNNPYGVPLRIPLLSPLSYERE